jgi:hypothetical protein
MVKIILQKQPVIKVEQFLRILAPLTKKLSPKQLLAFAIPAMATHHTNSGCLIANSTVALDAVAPGGKDPYGNIYIARMAY